MPLCDDIGDNAARIFTAQLTAPALRAVILDELHPYVYALDLRTEVAGGVDGRGRPVCFVERSEQRGCALKLIRLQTNCLVMRQRLDGRDVDRRQGHARAPLAGAVRDPGLREARPGWQWA